MLRVAFLRVIMLRAVFSMVALIVVLMVPPVAAQEAPQATDVTSAEIQKFINALPRDRVSDRAIRTVEVTGDYRVGVYGVFRPEEFPGGANLHPVNTTEIYYMLEGVATLVTGGTLIDSAPRPPAPVYAVPESRGVLPGESPRGTSSSSPATRRTGSVSSRPISSI